ncbi:hypothetical protein [Pseudochryseolinea flava]|uniref:Uncharacterized protein n=1 Tax=Pseudochryseolinea flava TaxID=2059302 RepID=A0A364XV31_9BACT|nr:hypothetical protein [Pseudochryseolinea flava]RAV97971.1 hypothetical protein DQQ10_26230 [Pseudochryseolinea flava]
MEYNTYKEYTDQEQVDALVEILEEHQIKYLVTSDRDSLDGLYGKNSYKKNFSVKIQPEDFAKVDVILRQLNEGVVTDVEKDHYLFGFSDNELVDVLAKADEWNEFDYVLARKILADRGQKVSDERIHQLKEERITLLAKPTPIWSGWIVLGYAFAFLGGFFGLFTGWHLNKSTKILPNGQRIFTYDDNVRSQGKQMMVISAVMITLAVILYIVSDVIGLT